MCVWGGGGGGGGGGTGRCKNLCGQLKAFAVPSLRFRHATLVYGR